MQHNATHCNTEETAFQGTHCNTLSRNATHCNTLQHTATHCNTLQHTVCWGHCLRCKVHTATHCNTHCNTLQHTATRCNTLHNTLQHTLQHWGDCQRRRRGHCSRCKVHPHTHTHICGYKHTSRSQKSARYSIWFMRVQINIFDSIWNMRV